MAFTGYAVERGAGLLQALSDTWRQLKADLEQAQEESSLLRQENRLLRLQLGAASASKLGLPPPSASEQVKDVHGGRASGPPEPDEHVEESVTGYFDASNESPPSVSQVRMVEAMVLKQQCPEEKKDLCRDAGAGEGARGRGRSPALVVETGSLSAFKSTRPSGSGVGAGGALAESDASAHHRVELPVAPEYAVEAVEIESCWTHHNSFNSEQSGQLPPVAEQLSTALSDLFSEDSERHKELRQQFDDLDRSGTDFITAADFEWLSRFLKKQSMDSPQDIAYFRAGIQGLNDALECESPGPGEPGITFEVFKTLMTEENLEMIVGEEVYHRLLPMRRMILQRSTEKMVLKMVGVTTERERAQEKSYRAKFLDRMEPVVGIIIMANAILMGISADNEDWGGWEYMEWAFTLVFAVELAVKISVMGFREFFLGEGGVFWNWFDFVIVTFAIIDIILTTTMQATTDNQLQAQQVRILRIARLVRLTRVMRVLQFKIFKDLQLMLQGVLFGLKTLFWAIILLFFVIYCVGLLVRTFVGLEHLDRTTCNDPVLGITDQKDCSTSELHLVRYKHHLFASVPRCMITIFRCFTDGCTSVDGSPLLVLMWDVYGLAFLIGYCVCVCFVTFGLFNLIMAVFVENTMEAAKTHRARRNLMTDENIRVARQLHWLVGKFTGGRDSRDSSCVTDETSRVALWFQAVRDWASDSRNGLLPPWARKRTQTLTELTFESGSMEVTREDFQSMITDKRVKKILDDLELNPSARDGLFDVLDADGSGTLEATELVKGILKLRGTPDKSDTIAALLGVRALQQSIKSLSSTVSRNQLRLETALGFANLAAQPASPTRRRSPASPTWSARGSRPWAPAPAEELSSPYPPSARNPRPSRPA